MATYVESIMPLREALRGQYVIPCVPEGNTWSAERTTQFLKALSAVRGPWRLEDTGWGVAPPALLGPLVTVPGEGGTRVLVEGHRKLTGALLLLSALRAFVHGGAGLPLTKQVDSAVAEVLCPMSDEAGWTGPSWPVLSPTYPGGLVLQTLLTSGQEPSWVSVQADRDRLEPREKVLWDQNAAGLWAMWEACQTWTHQEIGEPGLCLGLLEWLLGRVFVVPVKVPAGWPTLLDAALPKPLT